MSAITDFRDFILRGNVVDLAVGVVIGAAFGGVVKAFTEDFLTPLIAIPSKQAGPVNFKNLSFVIGGSTFPYGDFINVVITFLITAAVVFFFVVRPVNYLMSKRKTEPPVAPTTRECPECLSNIPLKATRCAFCTAQVPAAV